VYRQGDVLLKPIANIPLAAHRLKRDWEYPKVKGIVLAAGEATGHHHVVTDPWARLHIMDGQRYLHVSRRGARLVHEEHDTIELPHGDYVIQRQREYEPPREPSGGVRERSRPSTRWVYD